MPDSLRLLNARSGNAAPRLRFEPGMERLAALIGIGGFAAGTMPGLSTAHGVFLTRMALAVSVFFALQYGRRLIAAPRRTAWAFSGGAIVDLLAAIPVPLALMLGASSETARLYGVLWALKLVRFDSSFALLVRVMRSERRPLASVTMAFVVVVLFAATAAYLAERGGQPASFSSVPDALWWAVATVTTTGYGDKVPLTFAGRVLAGTLMVSGIGLFSLWAGILASGFAQELRRRDFLESWQHVARLPLFRDLGAATIASVARLLKVEIHGPGATIVRQGAPGDSMYFIAEGCVEVQSGMEPVRLSAGQFFGEMALLTGAPRNATIVTLTPTRLLRLDVVEFRGLASDQPELLRIIEAEGTRRASTSTA